MHQRSFKRSHTHNCITVNEWFVHFNGLLEKDTCDGDNDIENEACILDRPISGEEALIALKEIKLK